MTTCKYRKTGKFPSFPSHFYPQLRCVCARPHGASTLKWCYLQPPVENNLFMTTWKYRKTGKFPFPLPFTASLRVCQTPMRFLDPMCTRVRWSDVTCNRLKRTTCHDNLQVQENWQVPLPTSIHSFVACVPDAPAILGSNDSKMHMQPPEKNSLLMTICRDKKVGKSPFSDLQCRISDLGSWISDLGSRISNLESRISDLWSRISDLESRISNLESPLSGAFWIFCCECFFNFLAFHVVTVAGPIGTEAVLSNCQSRSCHERVLQKPFIAEAVHCRSC